jgi:hypothetical protein
VRKIAPREERCRHYHIQIIPGTASGRSGRSAQSAHLGASPTRLQLDLASKALGAHGGLAMLLAPHREGAATPGQPARTAELKCGGIGGDHGSSGGLQTGLAPGGSLGGLSSRTGSGRECREHWNRTASVVRHHTRLAPRHKGHVLTTPIIRVRCRVLWRFSPWALGRLASLVMAPSGWRDDRCARDRSCNPSRADWESGRRAHPER